MNVVCYSSCPYSISTPRASVDERIIVFHRHCIEAVINPSTTYHKRRNGLKWPVRRKNKHILQINKTTKNNRTRKWSEMNVILVLLQNGRKVRRFHQFGRKRDEWHLDYTGRDFEGCVNFLFLHSLGNDVHSRENLWIQQNVTIHVAVVGGGVSLGDCEKEIVYEGEMVWIRPERGNDINIHGVGEANERR